MSEKKSLNLKYLDGLRGWAAMVILIHHYVLIFFPPYISAIPNDLVGQLLTIPLRIFVAGKFMIYIFFTLSGFVLVYRYFLVSGRRIIISSAARRYFRLMIPTAAAVLFAYLLMKLGLADSSRIYEVSKGTLTAYNFQPNLFLILKDMFIIPLTAGYMSYNGVIFTITYEIIASFAIYCLIGLCGKYKIRYLIYILAGLSILKFLDSYYLPFLLGLVLCDLFVHFKKLFQLNGKWYIKIPLLFMAVYFGTFPFSSYVEHSRTIYSPILSSIGGNIQNNYFAFAAALILFVTLTAKSLQEVLEYKFMQFLGKIAFSLYLLHWPFAVGFSVTFLVFLRHYFSDSLANIIMLIVSACLLFPLVYLFHKFIEMPVINGSKYIYSYLEKKILLVFPLQRDNIS